MQGDCVISSSKLGAIVLAGGLVLAVPACGGSSDGGSASTTTAARSGGGDVDIDSEDGTVRYQDKHGNETEMALDGQGASLPDGWPSRLAPPASVTIITSNTSTIDGKPTMTVLGEAEGSIDGLQQAIKDRVADAGFDISQDTPADLTGGDYAGMTATKGDDTLVVAIARDPSGQVTLTMTLTSKA
jgi:hypothetical protein